MIQQFDGDEEGIHVDMQDVALRMLNRRRALVL